MKTDPLRGSRPRAYVSGQLVQIDQVLRVSVYMYWFHMESRFEVPADQVLALAETA
jgi:hypothetical protein